MPRFDLQEIEKDASRLEDGAVSDLVKALVDYIDSLEMRIIELETANRNP